jgi:hypothetical protein
MQNAEELNLGQISEFLKASYGIEFSGQNRAERYAWTERVLVAQEYASQGKKQRGQIRGYIAKVSGLSMPQVARLIRMYRANGKVETKTYRRRQFARKYTAADVALLAAADRAHERLSGPATRHILKREFEQYGKREYEHLAGISTGHLTICVRALGIGSRQPSSSRRGPVRWPSASGGGRTRKAYRDICGWTQCTKGIGMEAKGCTTSMRSTPSCSGK